MEVVTSRRNDHIWLWNLLCRMWLLFYLCTGNCKTAVTLWRSIWAKAGSNREARNGMMHAIKSVFTVYMTYCRPWPENSLLSLVVAAELSRSVTSSRWKRGCAQKLSARKKKVASYGGRTRDITIKSRTLLPTELMGLFKSSGIDT